MARRTDTGGLLQGRRHSHLTKGRIVAAHEQHDPRRLDLIAHHRP